MDENPSLSDESNKELKKMENDIDVFLSNIRENVSKNTEPQNEATCSGAHNEFDSISSDDMENESKSHPLPSTDNEPSVSNHDKKLSHTSSSGKELSHTSSSSKRKKAWKKLSWKHKQLNKWWKSNSRGKKPSIGGRGFIQEELSRSGDEYDQYMRPSSSRRYNDHLQDSFSPEEDEEYHWPLSAREEHEFHQEREPSRGVFVRERDEYSEEMSLSPEERDHHRKERLHSRERHRYKRRIISVEGMEEEEHSRDSYVFNETFGHSRTSVSRSSETESMYHKIYAEESDSPAFWYENEGNDYEDQNINPNWMHEDDSFIEDHEDDQGSSAGTMNAASLITACLDEVVAYNPEIAEKFSRACMSLLNKSVGRTCDSDYEHEESSCASFEDQSGRDSARSRRNSRSSTWRNSRSPSWRKSRSPSWRKSRSPSWRKSRSPSWRKSRSPSWRKSRSPSWRKSRSPSWRKSRSPSWRKSRSPSWRKSRSPSWRISRSPSFSKSLGSFSGPSGRRSHRDRYEGNSRRIVVECSQSPSPERGHSSGDRPKARYSSSYDKRSVPATSQVLSTNRRSFINHHKRDREEDPKTSVSRSIRKIRKQCEEERNSTVRRALLALLKVHQRECDMYLKKPEAHPDCNKEYRRFLEKKSKSILDLGGDPNDYNFQKDWKKYWPTQLVGLFKKSWETKMHKCTSMLLKKGYLSKSLSTSSRKDVTNAPPEKKQKVNKQGSEVNKEKSQTKPEEVKTLKQDGSQAASAPSEVKKEEMDTELLSILKLLNHIKHKFKDCEASFDLFYKKALSIKQKNLHLCDILPNNLPFLEKIDTNLKETLEDENLTLIQKAIIQETHERFKCFLKKTKEINSHCIKNYDNNDKNSVCVVENQQIQCHVTDLHSSVVTENITITPAHMFCDTKLQVCRPVRTLTEVSIQRSASQLAPSIQRQEEHCDTSQPPPPGVTPPPSGVFPLSPGITPSAEETPPPAEVIPPPPGVTPPSVSVTSTPSVAPPSDSIKSLPHHATPASSYTKTIPWNISVSSPVVTPPPPGVTPPPPTSHAHQSVVAHSQASCLGSHLKQSSDAASKTTQQPSTISTSVVQSSKSLRDEDITTSWRQTVQPPSKEFLRSTIRDCFLSTSSASELGVTTSTAEESITFNNKEESAVSSMPSLPEDILRMFVVKPENKSENNAKNKSTNEINISINTTKPAAKKRIKITIPQSSKGKGMPSLNPILDDQELL